MPCSCNTPSRICVPLEGPSTVTSGELDFVPNSQIGLADDGKHVIPQRNTTTMATLTEYTSSGSPSSHSSSTMSLSPATSTSSALCNEPDDNTIAACTSTTFTIGPWADDNGTPNEGPSTTASRRMAVEGKGKTPERIQEVTTFPMSCGTNITRWSKSANNAIGEEKYPQLDDNTSEFLEIEEPSTYSLESNSTLCDSDDDFADLSASVATIRPQNPVAMVTEPESSTSSVMNASEPVSRANSPHSDQGYTLEVRPPSSIMASRDGEESDAYGESPTISQSNSLRSRSTLSPASSPGSHTSRLNYGRQGVVTVSSPTGLLPVPPVASIRVRRPQPPSQDGSQSPWSTTRPSSLSGRRSALAEHPRSHTATSTARSPSLSPLAWETTPPVMQRPSTSAAPVDYLTGSWPSEIPDIPSDLHSNRLWSTPSTFRPASTPPVREEEVLSSPDSLVSVPVTDLSNPPSNPPESVPQRTTRFTVPLPPSPGSSLRMSTFNSPFASGASPIDSWGTPATLPGGPVYNQTTSIPSEGGWSDLPQPPLSTRNPTPTWLPEASSNGPNQLWTNVEWPGWHDTMQIPQVTPIATATPSPTPPGYLLICSYCGSPAPACVCRRYVRLAPVATPGGLRTPIRPPATPHPMFWFADGTVTFEVEDIFFKVHRYFFERHSEHFRNLLPRRLASTAPVKIPDAKKLDFERLLKVFYPSNLANPDLATVEEWTSVLTLAVKWHMDELITLSIQELTPITSAVDKISLAKKFGLFGYNLAPDSNYNRDWLLPALRELCGRNFPLRFEEARKLDMWTVVKVWEVQHEITNTGLNHNVSQIERLIKRRFGLE